MRRLIRFSDEISFARASTPHKPDLTPAMIKSPPARGTRAQSVNEEANKADERPRKATLFARRRGAEGLQSVNYKGPLVWKLTDLASDGQLGGGGGGGGREGGAGCDARRLDATTCEKRQLWAIKLGEAREEHGKM
ncbi:hypothetical protein IF1G_02450 [Cordyceps javanica]|uniref:Uncharacterized protein n=1 Tax=Cordyceps javanica TaxID=43265 RepID=A0A545V9H6_9HYPO|nr:hypothetical protein IF1G_02450 [Cordyceps javanica]